MNDKSAPGGGTVAGSGKNVALLLYLRVYSVSLDKILV